MLEGVSRRRQPVCHQVSAAALPRCHQVPFQRPSPRGGLGQANSKHVCWRVNHDPGALHTWVSLLDKCVRSGKIICVGVNIRHVELRQFQFIMILDTVTSTKHCGIRLCFSLLASAVNTSQLHHVCFTRMCKYCDGILLAQWCRDVC